MTRLKVTCNYVNKQPDGTAHLTFAPVTTGSDENKKFFKLTPAGQIMFYTINQDVVNQFENGKEYYVDISPVD